MSCARGTDGVSRVGLPSLSNLGRAVLATGAWQEVNGVTNNTRYELVAVDSLFSLARSSGLKTAIAGIHFWHRNLGSLATERFPGFPAEPHHADARTLVEYQRKLCNGLAASVHGSKAQLLVVDLHGRRSRFWARFRPGRAWS